MQQFTYVLGIAFFVLICSCANPEKPKGEVLENNDSLRVGNSQIEELTPTENKGPIVFASQVEITDLLTEGTYIEEHLPSSVDSGNWYALIGKEAGISEIVKIELSQIKYEPSEGEDFAVTIYVIPVPKLGDNAVILFHVQEPIDEGEIKGRKEERFIEPESNYELALPGFFLLGEGTSLTNDQDETSYSQYGLVLYQGDRVQQLYSALSCSNKTPLLIWSGDLNKDKFPDLIFQSSVDESDTEAHYQLWLSDPKEHEFAKVVAEHKIFPGA